MTKRLKIAVRKHKGISYRNIHGEKTRTNWYYTIAVLRFGFWWHDLKFWYPAVTRFSSRGDVKEILGRKEISFTFSPERYATYFDSEDDAIRVKNDIIQHPDKYLTRKY